nr:DNA polymerase I [uncultured bacterium]
MGLDDYREVWLVRFEALRRPGECPTPVCLTARELRGGRLVRLEQGGLGPTPPYPCGPEALFVAYDAPAALGCQLALGWPMPAQVLDLHAEYRCLTAGALPPGDYDLSAALARLGLDGAGVDGLARLLAAMWPHLDLPRALLRGRYTAAVARMEAVGVPVDVDRLDRLRAEWGRLQDALIRGVDSRYGVYQARKFNPVRWRAWANRHGIPWPRTAPGRLDLSLDTFRDMAEAYPEVRPMQELRATLALLRPAELPVGRDGRNRCPLRPFAAKTGRNAPSTTQFIFGPAVWVRGLIRPQPGMALAYVDYEQQEFGIAAALSQDQAMMAAYRSGDPYLAFAKQAGAVPADATKVTHRDQRERFKHCALGVQYGMGARSLAGRLGVPVAQAQELLALHRRTYPTYWRWSDAVERHAYAAGRLRAAFGWTLRVGADANARSVRNFPLQANGAEMLRLACCALTEGGVRVCAPVHDALLIEAPAGDIDQAVAVCEEAMRRASEYVLPGFPLRTDVKVVRHPERYMDPRGREMWDNMCWLLDRGPAARSA